MEFGTVPTVWHVLTNVKAHHTVGTVPNSIRTIVECQN
jgi:hypothetical protein